MCDVAMVGSQGRRRASRTLVPLAVRTALVSLKFQKRLDGLLILCSSLGCRIGCCSS